MNVYDFDGTIFKGDSSKDFFCFCLRRHPRLWLHIPRVAAAFWACRWGRLSKTRLREVFFGFLPRLACVETEVEAFWRSHEKRMQGWYLAQRQASDVVLSGSPQFLLAPICRKLGVACVIASPVEPKTGRFGGKDCLGEEKLARFASRYPDAVVDAFYSDSLSDAPMAAVARQAFFVKKGIVLPWRQTPET